MISIIVRDFRMKHIIYTKADSLSNFVVIYDYTEECSTVQLFCAVKAKM